MHFQVHQRKGNGLDNFPLLSDPDFNSHPLDGYSNDGSWYLIGDPSLGPGLGSSAVIRRAIIEDLRLDGKIILYRSVSKIYWDNDDDTDYYILCSSEHQGERVVLANMSVVLYPLVFCVVGCRIAHSQCGVASRERRESVSRQGQTDAQVMSTISVTKLGM